MIEFKSSDVLKVGEQFRIEEASDQPEWFKELYAGKLFEVVLVHPDGSGVRIEIVKEN